jgi:hypothetical protein
MPREAVEDRTVPRLRRRGARRHEHIHRGHLLSVQPEGFANQAPQAVPVDRVARRADADGHAEPRLALFTFHTLDDKQVIRETLARPARALELGGGVELVAGPQSETPRRKSLVSGVR